MCEKEEGPRKGDGCVFGHRCSVHDMTGVGVCRWIDGGASTGIFADCGGVVA